MNGNDVKIIITYYGQTDHLVNQLKFFNDLSGELKRHINLTFVNDGYYDSNLFEDILTSFSEELSIDGYKVTNDVGFNSHGCRNLAMIRSSYHWNLMMDIDCYLNEDIVSSIIEKELDENIFYVFKVDVTIEKAKKKYDYYDPKDLLKTVAHPNIFLINKPCFWSSGGYDPEFTGMRHGDKEFFFALDRDKYDHVLFEHDDKELIINLKSPLRQKSYINTQTQKAPGLKNTIDYVMERNDNKERKFKKRIISFPWQQVV